MRLISKQPLKTDPFCFSQGYLSDRLLHMAQQSSFCPVEMQWVVLSLDRHIGGADAFDALGEPDDTQLSWEAWNAKVDAVLEECSRLGERAPGE